ncbi:hypothetical protein [Halalkalibacter sp. APA_J-10(15)]|uniref:hypothetical protein n=1 Tax=Halalkalibacter sp. APA_J-10(15) TaxID=2933805 RepID=UPI001FF3B486|nr:hypothetical protein [Halalkalibacter sp. APA_J-10(15)]MCK0470871.1 hypothetical protein [Halalkalibacter sp. APA_J-10(15)]
MNYVEMLLSEDLNTTKACDKYFKDLGEGNAFLYLRIKLSQVTGLTQSEIGNLDFERFVDLLEFHDLLDGEEGVIWQI